MYSSLSSWSRVGGQLLHHDLIQEPRVAGAILNKSMKSTHDTFIYSPEPGPSLWTHWIIRETGRVCLKLCSHMSRKEGRNDWRTAGWWSPSHIVFLVMREKNTPVSSFIWFLCKFIIFFVCCHSHVWKDVFHCSRKAWGWDLGLLLGGGDCQEMGAQNLGTAP